MYGDRLLEFSVASRDAVAASTRALPLGQANLAEFEKDTSGMGAYYGLYVFASAGEDLAAGFSIELQHSDDKNGLFAPLVTFPATTEAKSAGDVIVKHPVPLNVKNWVKFKLSSASKVNIIIADDVDKWINGLVRGQ